MLILSLYSIYGLLGDVRQFADQAVFAIGIPIVLFIIRTFKQMHFQYATTRNRVVYIAVIVSATNL